MKKYRVSVLAVASVSLLEAAGNATPDVGRADNWYLRAPDGSRQGPYESAQLRDWSAAGYVSPGELLRNECLDLNQAES